jgi:hypothetical protein
MPGALRSRPCVGWQNEHPWIKKNAVMSIILTAANAWVGALRGHTTTVTRRNMAAAMKQARKKRKRKHRAF